MFAFAHTQLQLLRSPAPLLEEPQLTDGFGEMCLIKLQTLLGRQGTLVPQWKVCVVSELRGAPMCSAGNPRGAHASHQVSGARYFPRSDLLRLLQESTIHHPAAKAFIVSVVLKQVCRVNPN